MTVLSALLVSPLSSYPLLPILAPRRRSTHPTVLPGGSLDRKRAVSIGSGANSRFVQTIPPVQEKNKVNFQTKRSFWRFAGARWIPVCRLMVLTWSATIFTRMNKQNDAVRYLHEKKAIGWKADVISVAVIRAAFERRNEANSVARWFSSGCLRWTFSRLSQVLAKTVEMRVLLIASFLAVFRTESVPDSAVSP